ncbi:pyruvate formate-lyase-activating protein [Rhodoplanes sp. TEM]|uniref:Pyruvate formate-lyase-activating enzyme n=1 Tax=Rhodoplanes tepidamans TaxID=200616 RepID=A0ABT5J693_RHOTP|nr:MULTISPECIES: pyruvate formate-lyase-activating protein [Rhodoplanes]MDC7785172.1 pyruvate formate-lyase-activating protein [Rhodoplanes tepidamans]MDC7987122.1 pyruvate formate-lyase-activating protein [Rhodoplanes sp. TEM]MDQ0353429.1 pyruvate formate lyase activating enzyme [Rhodoplanes tepidamans]
MTFTSSLARGHGDAPACIVVPPAAGVAGEAPVGFLHSVESGAAGDGPGMRFVFFMAGCPLRCLYCHNPDTWKLKAGRRIDLDEALAEIAPYRGFLRLAGGVTVSGGEPMTQARFVGALLTRLHDDLRLHTALDTTGFLGRSVDDDWFDPVDLVLLDVKHSDPAVYKRITGRDLAPTLDFARRMVRLGKPMWIRYVLVPGLTDGEAEIARLADLLAGLGPLVQQVDVLPYHRLGVHKWAELGRAYPLDGTEPPSREALDAAIAIFRTRGLKVR